MKNYVKAALDTLTALDFNLDHEDRKLRGDRWIFTHANAPEDRVIISHHHSELACRTAVQRAKQIVGLATSDATLKPRAKANARAKADRAAERRKIEAQRRLADAKDAEAKAKALEAARRRQVADLQRLMVGRDNKVDASAVRKGDMLTPEQVADLTGLQDKHVHRAIASGALEAYQCGKQIKVKGGDVRAWLGRRSA